MNADGGHRAAGTVKASSATTLRPSLVKLGGSVITQKRGVPRLRPKVLRRLAEEITTADHPVIVLHGAGSFGHPAARRFGLHAAPTGPPADPRRARGAAIVSAEVRRLHGAVLDALLGAGGRPWSVPPSAFATQNRGGLESLDERPVRTALSQGLTPLSFGDVVVDTSWGFSILSGDTLAIELARRFVARRVLFVSDVEGVCDPSVEGRRSVLPVVTRDLVAALTERTRGPDVTGGIRGKVEAMLAIAENGCDAGLISGLTDGALSRALKGEPVYGSWSKAGSR
ncbi:MAG TPA: isopentenyl phosphate kinase [Thermoplasmata archaeon]|nr:isopentenyl phosphate kinase [Thermoplasmata archaeon]